MDTVKKEIDDYEVKHTSTENNVDASSLYYSDGTNIYPVYDDELFPGIDEPDIPDEPY